jgi:P-type Cu+ transporter
MFMYRVLQVVVSLQKRGIAVWMVTGDNTLTALTVASQLSIPHDRVMSQVDNHSLVNN